MNDVPEPQLKPLISGNEERTSQHGRGPNGLTSKLVIASAIVVACLGGALWHQSTSLSNGSGPETAVSPSAAGGGQAEPQIRADATHLGVQLALISASQAPSALAKTDFSQEQKTQILAAIKNRRMRLVRMPIAQVAGLPGQILTITSGGMTQSLRLKPSLQAVVLPIYIAGEVTVTPATPPPAGGLQAGVLTALGPLILPVLATLNQQVVLDVIVQ